MAKLSIQMVQCMLKLMASVTVWVIIRRLILMGVLCLSHWAWLSLKALAFTYLWYRRFDIKKNMSTVYHGSITHMHIWSSWILCNLYIHAIHAKRVSFHFLDVLYFILFSLFCRFLPYVGWVTIIMTEKPIIKVCLYWNLEWLLACVYP